MMLKKHKTIINKAVCKKIINKMHETVILWSQSLNGSMGQVMGKKPSLIIIDLISTDNQSLLFKVLSSIIS